MLKRVQHAVHVKQVSVRCHRNCKVLFFRKSPRNAGRPHDVEKKEAFECLCKFLESNDKFQYSLSELQQKMEECGTDAYSKPYLKSKLFETFGDNITVTDLPGRPGVVSFQNTAKEILVLSMFLGLVLVCTWIQSLFLDFVVGSLVYLNYLSDNIMGYTHFFYIGAHSSFTCVQSGAVTKHSCRSLHAAMTHRRAFEEHKIVYFFVSR